MKLKRRVFDLLGMRYVGRKEGGKAGGREGGREGSRKEQKSRSKPSTHQASSTSLPSSPSPSDPMSRPGRTAFKSSATMKARPTSPI